MADWARRFFCFLFFVLALHWPGTADATPQAHILRIDPQTSLVDGHPSLTTIIDLTESQRASQLTRACAELSGDEEVDCVSKALEKPGALWTPYPFVKDDAVFSVRIDGKDHPARLEQHASFGESQNEARIGTAYLLVIDADSHIGKAFDEAQAIAEQFIRSMGPNDWVYVAYLGPSEVLSDSGWLDIGQQETALERVSAQKKTVSSRDRTRPLLDLIKQSATDAFRSLGSGIQGKTPPMHQAMVVLSSGYGGGDLSTTGPGATQLSQFFTSGRFDEENTAIPKLPVPIVSIYAPPSGMAENRQLAHAFMENLANPQIGGFYTAIRDGEEERHKRIVDSVRSRFANMIVARFSLSCLAPTATQSFSLLFRGNSKSVVGDTSFADVPIGFDPSRWPLDVDAELTRTEAQKKGGIYPGDTLRVYGSFCWGNDLARPEVYFIPPGESLPKDLSDPEAAAEMQKRLISLDMRGKTLQANSSFAEFQVPASEQILHGDGERRTVRLVVVDSGSHRTSGLSELTVLSLKGTQKPLPIRLLVAAACVALVLLLLLAILVRRGAKTERTPSSRGSTTTQESPYATPAPVSRVPRPAVAETRASLEGDAGRFVVLPGSDLRAGRDGSRCAAVLPHAQVSGLHATFRLDGDVLLVRDEGSTSGTRVQGKLLEAGVWEKLTDGCDVQLGPERLRVSLSSMKQS